MCFPYTNYNRDKSVRCIKENYMVCLINVALILEDPNCVKFGYRYLESSIGFVCSYPRYGDLSGRRMVFLFFRLWLTSSFFIFLFPLQGKRKAWQQLQHAASKQSTREICSTVLCQMRWRPSANTTLTGVYTEGAQVCLAKGVILQGMPPTVTPLQRKTPLGFAMCL